jgi:hypothetical protein
MKNVSIPETTLPDGFEHVCGEMWQSAFKLKRSFQI